MDFDKCRRLMVDQQLKARGIKDERVLRAMETIERHRFVDISYIESAYDDCALPIGEEQTISQPYMVAVMTELLELKGHEKVLEIGTGSGYQSAVLSRLAAEVFSIERIEPLAQKARRRLEEIGCHNVHVFVADGTRGFPEKAPFDGIIVTAGAPEIPQHYLEQLNMEGRLVIPVGSRYSQILYRIIKKPEGIMKTTSTACVFVPLVGKHGWKERDTC